MRCDPAITSAAGLNSLGSHFDSLCDRFEAALKAGPARIEDFLAEAPASERDRLFSELLALEIDIRRQRGEVPCDDEYRARFADFAPLIAASFEATLPPAGEATPGGNGHRSGKAAAPTAAAAKARFRILRPYAEGGLGIVSIARDEQLGRNVALKEIKPSLADRSESRDRFMLEAEVTGGLEHPGIVPVYGLGRFEDGRPYYAMRFINGESLQEAVRRYHDSATAASGRRSVELRKLLRRFLDVCQTIAYAHSRGVLHRDLKPANIMLGPFGETLVVDWGLAKVIQRAEPSPDPNRAPLAVASAVTATRMDSTIGTPQYMSPEQAAGQIDRLGPASDVYGLGATLYYLLTGKPPVSGEEMTTLLEKVRQGDFLPPRQVAPGVAAPLEAICLKAMARRPEERYASPQALADDIERWLADEPVMAYRDPLAVRLSRAARRHKTVTSAVAALLLTAVAALSVGNVLLGREQARTEKARQAAQENFVKADEARRRADEAKLREQQAAKNARDNYDLVYATFRTLVFDIQHRLSGVPGGATARRELLTTAVSGLDKLAENARQQNDLRTSHNVMFALTELGDLYQESGDDQGLHNFEKARGCFDRALKLAQSLAQADPGNITAQRELAQAYERLGFLCHQSGDLPGGRKYYQLCNDISAPLARANPGNVLIQRDAWVASKGLANAAFKMDDAKAAREGYQACVDGALSLSQANPSSLLAKCDLALSYALLGNAYLKLDDLEVARHNYEQAMTLEPLLTPAGQSRLPKGTVLPLTYIILDLTFACNGLGDVSLKQNDPGAARKSFERSAAYVRLWAQHDPRNLHMLHDMTSPTCRRLGEVCDQLHDYAASAGYWKQRLPADQILAQADPQNAGLHREVLLDYRRLAHAQRQVSALADAKENFAAAIEQLQQMAKNGQMPAAGELAELKAALQECEDAARKTDSKRGSR